MNNISIILINISLILFILGSIIELVMVSKLYREIDKEEELDKTIDEAIDKLVGDK